MASSWHKKDGHKSKIKTRDRIDVRCTPKEKELIIRLAKKAGLGMSEYVKMRLFGKKIVLRATDDELVEV